MVLVWDLVKSFGIAVLESPPFVVLLCVASICGSKRGGGDGSVCIVDALLVRLDFSF